MCYVGELHKDHDWLIDLFYLRHPLWTLTRTIHCPLVVVRQDMPPVNCLQEQWE